MSIKTEDLRCWPNELRKRVRENEKRYLITYCCEGLRKISWGHEVVENPISFLKEVAGFKDEVYYLVNVLPITREEAEEIDDKLPGM